MNDSGNIFKTIKPIYKEIKASKRITKKRIAKSLSNFANKQSTPSNFLPKNLKNG